MDVLTEKGAQTLRQEQRAAELWMSKFPSLIYIETDKREPADVDGIIIQGRRLHAVVECKCRDFSLQTFKNQFYCEWLVTAEKILKGMALSSSLRTPLVGWLYLVPDDALLFARLTNADGRLCVPNRTERTITQKTVNGGTIERLNMFLNMESAKIIARPLAP